MIERQVVKSVQQIHCTVVLFVLKMDNTIASSLQLLFNPAIINCQISYVHHGRMDYKGGFWRWSLTSKGSIQGECSIQHTRNVLSLS